MRWHKVGIVSAVLILTIAPSVSAADINGLAKPIARHVAYLHTGGDEQVFSVRVDSYTQLKVVLAHDLVDGPRETVASMCRRYHCLAAVNGDFYGGPRPHGGIVSAGHVFRTSYSESGQVWLGSSMRFEQAPLAEGVRIFAGKGQTFALPLNAASKIPRSALFSSSYGATIPISPLNGTYIYQCSCRYRPDVEGESYSMSLIRQVRMQPIHLRLNQIAFSLFGTDAIKFAALPHRNIAIRMPVVESEEAIGAHPVLLQKGKIVPTLTNFFATSLHPRTVLGRNARGQVWLIAIDTRVSLTKAAQIAQRLGATDAINMDGGGSTTFVVQGRTLNNPADKAERAVASAILVVKSTTLKTMMYKPTHQKSLPKKLPFTLVKYSPIIIPTKPFQVTKAPNASLQYALSAEQGGNSVFGLGAVLMFAALIIRRMTSERFHLE